MSIQRTDYVVVGVNLKKDFPELDLWKLWDEADPENQYSADDRYDELSNIDTDHVGIIQSSMSDDYEIVCVLIVPYQTSGYNGLDYTEIEVDGVDLAEKADLVRQFCKTEFDIDAKPKLIAFTDWW